jgi:hypothetical protein
VYVYTLRFMSKVIASLGCLICMWRWLIGCHNWAFGKFLCKELVLIKFSRDESLITAHCFMDGVGLLIL